MKLKNAIAAVLCLSVCLCTASCGGGDSNGDTGINSTDVSDSDPSSENVSQQKPVRTISEAERAAGASNDNPDYVPIDTSGMTAVDNGYIVIHGTKDTVVIYNQPSSDGYMNGFIIKNTPVEILENKDGWLLVRGTDIEHKTISGYVQSEYVSAELPDNQ